MTNGKMTLVFSNAGGIIPFTMRVDAPPFNDVRVRQAMRLLVDRKQMRELVFGGHGLLGNDVTSPFDVAYDTAPSPARGRRQAGEIPPQEGRQGGPHGRPGHDADRPRCRAGSPGPRPAGDEGRRGDGQPEDVARRPTSSARNYLKWVFAQDLYYYSPYMLQVTDAFLPTSPYNETHFNDPHYTCSTTRRRRRRRRQPSPRSSRR